MDNNLAMNGVEAMITREYDYKDWLHYYRNTWRRNVVAHTIDVNDDAKRFEVFPGDLVDQDGATIPLALRLEIRKGHLSNAQKVLASIDALLANFEKFEEIQTPEYLAPIELDKEGKRVVKVEDKKPEVAAVGTEKVEEKKEVAKEEIKTTAPGQAVGDQPSPEAKI